jgi:TP901 family phage tail tape measure protein
MSTETKLDTVFYEIEAKTDLFDRQIDRARQSLRALTGEKPPAIPVKADTTPLDRDIDRTKRKIKEEFGPGNATTVKLSGDIQQLEKALDEAKRSAAELGATRAGKPMVATLDAQISAFEAKITRAKAQVAQLTSQPQSVKFDAQATSLTSALKKLSLDIGDFGEKTAGHLNVSPPLEESTSAAKAFADEFEVAGTRVGASATEMAAKLANPYTAVAALTTALATLTVVGTQEAAKLDTAFRSLEAALPQGTSVDGLGSLKTEIVELSKVTPRLPGELAATAKAITDMGTADPAEVGRNLRTLALVGDALGKTDLNPLADQLDLIGDAFGLTGEGARQAYVQIVAMAKGRIDIDDLSGVLSKSATRMNALGISAQEAASAMVVLVDAGVNSRQITTGLIDLLDKAGNAQRAALEAAAAGKENDAKSLRIFASTVNDANVRSLGLVGTLGKLYTELEGNRDAFQSAGLSLNDYQIAQKAAAASIDTANTKVLSYADSLAKLAPAAQLNRESAGALSQIIKNELSAQLVDLGNIFLPKVISGLQLMADLLSRTRREAKGAAEALPTIAGQLDKGATGFASRRAQPIIANINQTPGFLDGFDVKQLLSLQSVLVKLDAQGESGEGLAKALATVRDRIREVNGAASNVITVVPPAAKNLDDLAAKAAALAQKNAELEQRFQSAIEGIKDYGESLNESDQPMAAFERRQDAIRRELDKVIGTLPKVRQASARLQANTILDQLADAGERLRDSQSIELAGKLADLLAGQSTNAVDAIARQYAELEKRLTAVAAAADSLGTEEGKLTAQRAREGIAAIQGQRDALIDVERVAQEFARSLQTITTFERQSNAGFAETGVTLADYRKALGDLAREESRLREIRDRAAEGTVARTKAEEALKAVQAKRLEIEKNGEQAIPKSAEAVGLAQRLGSSLKVAAQAGLGLVQIIGQGNSELGAMLAGVGSLAAGIEGIAAAAQKAGGFSKLFSSGAGIASVIPALTQTVGGIVAVSQSLGGNDQAGKALRDTMEANTAAIVLLSRNLNDLGASFSGTQLRGVFDGIQRLFSEGRTPSNFLNLGVAKIGQKYNNYSLGDERLPDYVKIDPNKFFASVGTSMADVEAVAKKLGITLDGSVGSYRKLAEALAKADFEALSNTLEGITRRFSILNKIAGTSNDPLEQVANKFRSIVGIAPEIAKIFDVNDVFTSEGRARLRAKVADLLTEVLSFDADSPEAKDFMLNKLGGLSLDEFLTLFGGILDGLDDFRDGLESFVDGLDVFQKAARVFGSQGISYVTGLINAYGNKFGSLQGLLDGVDLSTADGVATVLSRLRARFAELLEGGLTLEEADIADAILDIIGTLEQLPAALDPLSQAINAASEKFGIFGTSAKDQFTELGAYFKAKFPFKGPTGLADVLGPDFQNEIGTEAGRTKLKDNIGAAINAILADGKITDAERPLLDALKQLFSLVNQTIKDAADEAQKNADDVANTASTAEQTRQAGLGGRARDARMNIGLNDLTGAEAFTASLQGYSAAFAALFATFDVTTLEGIDAANAGLIDIYNSLATMTDAEILDKFGMTRDEVLTALADVEGGLDGLSSTLQDFKKRGVDFVKDLNIEFLNATGQGLEAVKIQTQLWVEQMIATAKTLGVWTQEIENQIRAVGTSRINNAASAAAPQSSVSGSSARAESAAADVRTIDGEITAQRVQSITAAEAMTLTNVLASSLVEHRAIRLAAEQMAAMLSVLVGGPLPSLQVPSLPMGTGQYGASAPGMFTLIVNLNGPIVGQSAGDAGRQLAEAALPYLNESLARAAGIEARLAGVPLT